MSESPPSKLARTNSNLEINTINNNIDQMECMETNYQGNNPVIFEDLPEAPSWSVYLESPQSYRPHKAFLDPKFFQDEETALTHCIRNQLFAAFEGLIKAGADPNSPSKKGVTPISAAAHKGNIHVMQLLIDAGSTVNSLNTSGSTALIQAAHFGHVDAVKLLLKNNATADFANGKGTTALMRASQEGHVDISRELILACVDVNRKNNEGMNALMLASQRGHADIVSLLIKAGATMDEQTSQGSTALMLACKRGHEKCAEVLVAQGAEIYMKDKRGRTAKDTATRRNHTGLLVWLSTRVQVSRMQEQRHKFRNILFSELRQAYLKGKLVLNPMEQTISDLCDAVKYKNNNKIISEFLLALDAKLPAVSRTPQQVLDKIKESNENNINDIISKIPNYNNNIKLLKRHKGFQDWKWTALLFRCMSMPSGVFENIVEMIPIPRIWQWSMLRIKRRCKLSPYQSLKDMSDVMDGILCDACIFSGDQSNLLIKISRSPQIHDYLLNQLEMPESLLNSLIEWSDVQNLLSRCRDEDIEVTYKLPLAREMLHVAITLYRWHKSRISGVKYLGLANTSDNMLTASNCSSILAGLRLVNGSTAQELDDVDMMEATDAGGEDENSENEDNEGIVVELDTENELLDNNNFNLEDSDNDDGNQMNVVVFGNNM